MEQEVSSYEEMTAATNQILCHALPEAFLPLPPAEVQGVDVTPSLHGEGQLPTLPSGFSSPGERSVNSRSPRKPPPPTFGVSGALYLSVVLATQAVGKMWR